MELEENVRREKLPLITLVLVAVNVLVYIVTEWKGSTLDADYMIQAGAMYGPALVEQHEYYRIVTHFFMHFGMEHLGNNMVSLLVLGYELEKNMGSRWFGTLYLFSGIFAGGASAVHLYSTEGWESTVSCGASGAIYGLMGALLIQLMVEGRRKAGSEVPRFLIYIALSLYSGMQDPGIDNAAHVGGFVGGVLICLIVCVLKRRRYYRKEQVAS